MKDLTPRIYQDFVSPITEEGYPVERLRICLSQDLPEDGNYQLEYSLEGTTKRIDLEYPDTTFTVPLSEQKRELGYVIYRNGIEIEGGKVTLKPFRFYDLNLIMNAHTDIGYTDHQCSIDCGITQPVGNSYGRL